MVDDDDEGVVVEVFPGSVTDGAGNVADVLAGDVVSFASVVGEDVGDDTGTDSLAMVANWKAAAATARRRATE